MRTQELQRAVYEALFASGYAALHFINCDVDGSRAVLHGSVPTYHLKQLAQEVAQRVGGVTGIENRLEVERSRRAR